MAAFNEVPERLSSPMTSAAESKSDSPFKSSKRSSIERPSPSKEPIVLRIFSKRSLSFLRV